MQTRDSVVYAARPTELRATKKEHEACEKLALNHGMIASFSRGLLQDLRSQQSDDEFDATLGAAIDQIQAASVT